MDAEVKVLKYDGGTGIIDQYIQFCKILDQQRALYPEDGMKAVYETIRICTDADILKEYLQERKQEVIDIMTLLYNQEQATKTMLETERKEGMAAGLATGLAKGMATGLAKGMATGENRLSQLINIFLGNKEYDKVTLVTSDAHAREAFYKQYGIT